jgi:hypothetical protein
MQMQQSAPQSHAQLHLFPGQSFWSFLQLELAELVLTSSYLRLAMRITVYGLRVLRLTKNSHSLSGSSVCPAHFAVLLLAI